MVNVLSVALSVLPLVVGCSLSTSAVWDAGDADAGRLDTGVAADARADDSGRMDGSAPADTSPPEDVGPGDSGFIDTGSADTGSADIGSADTGAPDTGTPDTGPADTGVVAPPSCDSLFASRVAGYVACEERADECEFFTTPGGMNCNDVCALAGRSCVESWHDISDDCTRRDLAGCDTGHGDGICICER